MTRTLFGLMGALLALTPTGVTRIYEAIAFENPEACEPRRRLVRIARAEGVVFALAALVGGRAYDRLMDLTGIAAALALLFPKRYLETGTSIMYEDSQALEWREG